MDGKRKRQDEAFFVRLVLYNTIHIIMGIIILYLYAIKKKKKKIGFTHRKVRTNIIHTIHKHNNNDNKRWR